MDPDEPLRRAWKIERDARDRGADPARVIQTLDAREPDRQSILRNASTPIPSCAGALGAGPGALHRGRATRSTCARSWIASPWNGR
jgi:hypothetical protein